MDEIAKALNQLVITMDFIAIMLVVIAFKDMSGSNSISHLGMDITQRIDEILRRLKK